MTAFLSVLLLLLIQGSSQTSLDDVLANVEGYVADYEPRLSHCVAREEYVQRLTTPGGRSRRLTSEFLFIK